MLWFVGAGLAGVQSLTMQAKDVISKSDAVFVEQFTSPTGIEYFAEIEKLALGKTHAIKRWAVEDGNKILNVSKTGTAVLISWGDPYVATTHTELRTRAITSGIKTGTIHGASVLTAMVGECGLHQYKIGKTVTIMSESNQSTTPYYTIYKNMIQGAHTILLLEYNQDKDYFLDPVDALKILQEAEKGQRRRVIIKDTFCLVASRIGSQNQRIVAGNISHIIKKEFGNPPHALIIPSSLHFTESDAINALAECIDAPSDNSQKTPSIPKQMLKKYVPMIEHAISESKKLCKGDAHLEEVLDGASRYTDDAKQFLDDGQEDLAVLCIGYADGLADAVRIARGLEPAGASN
ncbi:MAG: diphthine synthase [Cenarchaeum symbiont of Oopsacas minuta]|nr:diphthine synthase [Cenarchaeum symbiont of Oopsacas minuta]